MNVTLARHALRSSMWAGGAVLVGSVASFLGNLLLVRMLSPTDFGGYAFAASVVAVVFVVGGFGSQEAIIQCRDESVEGLIPTALLISGAIGVGLGVLATLAGLLVVRSYGTGVAHAVVALAWISALNSIGYAYGSILQREMRFRATSVITVGATFLSFAMAVLAARSGWTLSALVLRDGVQACLLTAAYFIASRYWVSWAFHRKAARWIWDFGSKMLVHRFAEVLFGRVDNLAVAKFMGAGPLGHYSLAYRLGSVGQQFTQGAVQPVFFSTFAAAQHDGARLGRAFSTGAYWLIRVCCLLGLLVWFVGRDTVVLLYGAKWTIAGEVFREFAPFVALLPLQENARVFLIGAGAVNQAVRSRLVQVAAFVPAVVVAARWGTLLTVAWTANAALLLATALLMRDIGRRVDVQWHRLATVPLVATGATIATLFVLPSVDVPHLPPIIRLADRLCLATLLYTGLLLVLEWKQLATQAGNLRHYLRSPA